MGFTTGFTGGVTLTLGLAYLTVVTHQRNREQQAAMLRQQTYLVSGITDRHPPILPPTRAELAAAERANLVEAAKDRWNAEVESLVRYVQNKDWEEVREGVEFAARRLWARATGGTEAVEIRGQQVARDVKNEAAGVAAAAKSAYADAKAKSEDAADAAKGSIFGMLGKGVQRAKQAVVGAEQKIGDAAAAAASGSSSAATAPPPSVEEALRQRFEKPSGDADNKTVEEVLAERYTATEQRDKTKLRAL